jgi:uncharacterized protein (TIGR00369 family)
MDDKSGKQAIEYGIVPIDVMASMSGLDFVRAIFARRLPEPPIMQTVEPFDCTVEAGAVVIHSVPGLRHYNPIGSVHGGYAAILLDSAMGLAVQSTLPAGTGYTTLEFKISFVRGMSETSGVIRTEGRVLNAGRRVATAEARITDAKDRLLAHATTTCLVFEFPEGERERLTLNWGRQSDSHAAGAKNGRVCAAEERPIAFRYKTRRLRSGTQRLRSGCPCFMKKH